MNRRHLLVLVLSAFYVCCKPDAKAPVSNKVGEVDTTTFFQVAQYFHSQITAVNKTPYYIYRIDVTNNKRDSTPINNQIFNQLSTDFYSPDINNPDLKKYYTENIFFDETTKAFTFSYSTTNKTLEIQNVEILLKEDGETVKRVFIRKFFNYPDSSAIEQLSWKPNESFQINRAVQKSDNIEYSRKTTVVWNEKR